MGLKAFHSINHYHLKLFPKNIFIYNQNNLVIQDSQLYKFLYDEGKFEKNFKFNSLLYFPPEILSNKASYSTNTNIWMFGIILYNMMTLELPFTTTNEILSHKGPNVVLSKNKEIYTKSLNHLLDMCLDVNHLGRPHINQLVERKIFTQLLPLPNCIIILFIE